MDQVMDRENGACGGRLELDNQAGPAHPCPPLGLPDLVLHPRFLLQSISMKISCRGLDLDQAGGSRVAGAVSWSVGPSVAAWWLPAPRSQAPSCDRGSCSFLCPKASLFAPALS